MASTMRSILFEQTGNPLDVLKVHKVPVPEPKPGEVRIKVHARPINPADLMFVRGFYGIKPKLPSSVGFEGMGTVDAVGEGVDIREGTRVSFSALGSWSEYIIVSSKIIIPVPDTISDETAAQLFVNPFTVYALLHEMNLSKGDWLMITAAGSALGKMLIGICKKEGIKTMGTVRRDDLISELKALGADEVINTTESKLSERVDEITKGKGVQCVLDAVGGKTGAAALDCLAHNGTMLVYGALSQEPIPLNSGTMIFKSLHVKGFWLVDWMRNTDRKIQQQVQESVIKWLSSAKDPLPVDAKYDLEDIIKAVIHADSAGRNGKILLTS